MKLLKKRICIISGIILLLSCFTCLGVRIAEVNSSRKMLRVVQLENTELYLENYEYFCDTLQYAHGYEVAVFSVDKSRWKQPDSWSVPEAAVSVEQLARDLGVAVNMNVIMDLGLGDIIGTSYFWVDNRKALSFNEQDYYFAICDSTNRNSMVLLIYRGHHLYGL